jgi:hypothetical protein
MKRANTTCRNVYDLAQWLWTDSSKFKRDNWGTSNPFRRLFAEASNAIEVRLGLEARTQWRIEFLVHPTTRRGDPILQGPANPFAIPTLRRRQLPTHRLG